MSDDAATCSICKLPVLRGQCIHGAVGDHWDCMYPAGNPYQSMAEIFAKGDAALSKMLDAAGIKPRRPKRREGEGATAQKCRAWAEAALTKAVGAPVTINSMWNQQGVYRGPRWDLDAWGVSFSIEGSRAGGTASCLATMTDCIKAKGIAARPSDSGGAWCFDLHPLGDVGQTKPVTVRSYKHA